MRTATPIVVGLSGGVDSALAAALLVEWGYDVVAVFLAITVAETGEPCPMQEDLHMAQRVAATLDIPLRVIDASEQYRKDVYEEFIASYERGETPNPDTRCNERVKFPVLLRAAAALGASRIATGHYARLRRVGVRCDLLRGVDRAKDQSYFLATLTREQLAMCEFPIGDWQKDNVRTEAKRRGLPNWDRRSTRGVCFLGKIDVEEVVRTVHPNVTASLVSTDGSRVGSTDAARTLTVGQRVRVSGQRAPRYVIAKNLERRSIVVSDGPNDPARETRVVTASRPHWIGAVPPSPFHATARIRHRQDPQPCAVAVHADGGGVVATFDAPLSGAAPGQTIVFSDHDQILGSATIDVSHGGNEGARSSS